MVDESAVPTKGNPCGCKCCGARHVLAALGCLSMAITYILKLDLNIALVIMVNHTQVKGENVSFNPEGVVTDPKNDEDGPFVWDESLQGWIKGSYFAGYIAFQIIGGRLCELYSAKWVMLISVIVNIVGTLLTPGASSLHYGALMVVRVIMGMGAAVTFPAMHCLLGRWAPVNERGSLSSITYTGCSLGSVFSYFTAGKIGAHLGWEWVFYILGAVCVPWCLAWWIYIQDRPSKQRLMTQEERDLITASLGEVDVKQAKRAVPWKSIFTSCPCWTLIITHLGSNWGWYMIIIETPTYIFQILKYKMKDNAIVSSSPYLFLWIFSFFVSRIMDYFIKTGKLPLLVARKIGTALASLVPAICLLVICFVGANRIIILVMINLGVMCIAGKYCGFFCTHMDLAPNYAGTLIGISNTVGTIPGIVVPIMVGQITKGNQTVEAWRIIFGTGVVAYGIMFIVFTLFASATQQKWNKAPEEQAQ